MSLPEQLANTVKKNDSYMGFIFWSEIYLNNMSGKKNEDGLDQR